MPRLTPTIGTAWPRLKPTACRESTHGPTAGVTTEAPISEKLPQIRDKPLLLVDIDGVISLFGFEPDVRPDGRWHLIEGIAHFLSSTAAAHLHAWPSGSISSGAAAGRRGPTSTSPTLLGVPALAPPVLRPKPGRGRTRHWKLAAIDAHAGDRPLAWVDDALDERVRRLGRGAPAPTLLVAPTPPSA